MEELTDLMHTIRNATKIADILIAQGQTDLLPTILEYIFEQSQTVLNDYCVKE